MSLNRRAIMSELAAALQESIYRRERAARLAAAVPTVAADGKEASARAVSTSELPRLPAPSERALEGEVLSPLRMGTPNDHVLGPGLASVSNRQVEELERAWRGGLTSEYDPY